MQEQRSKEAKKAEATLVPTQLATRSSLSQDNKPHVLLLLLLLLLDILDLSELLLVMLLVDWNGICSNKKDEHRVKAWNFLCGD
jgi:hypothetical protein